MHGPTARMPLLPADALTIRAEPLPVSTGGGSALRLSKKAIGRKSSISSGKELQDGDFFSLFLQNAVGPCVERFLLSASCASYRIHIRLQRRTPCPCSLSDSLRACQKQSFLTRSHWLSQWFSFKKKCPAGDYPQGTVLKLQAIKENVYFFFCRSVPAPEG